MSRWSPYAAGALFVSAGAMHFVKPEFFESIVPEWFPNAKLANQLSGAAEIALGIGMWVPQTRRASALGLLALTAAVFPANIDMATNGVEVKPVDGKLARSVGTAKGPQNWIRLPMQLPLAWWLWREAGAAG